MEFIVVVMSRKDGMDEIRGLWHMVCNKFGQIPYSIG